MRDSRSIEDLVGGDVDREQVFRFFVFFSRFEFALKRCGYTRSSRGHAEPNWDKLAEELKGSLRIDAEPKLSEQIDYMISQPPGKQVIRDNTIAFKEMKRGNESEARWLLRLAQQVRNNLFHGGKYPFARGPEPERDPQLLRAAISVLERCLVLKPNLDACFWETGV